MSDIKFKDSKEPCLDCKKTFQVPIQRGRPATRCVECRDKKLAESMVDVEINLDNIYSGPAEALKGSRSHKPQGAEAQCVRCNRLFTSDSACEFHKDYRTTEVCRDPATLGMVPRERREIPVWTKPSDRFGVSGADV